MNQKHSKEYKSIGQTIKKYRDGNRTRDLRTTNATLYRLSHSSIT